VGLGKTLVKEKRLFYETENLHKILYTIDYRFHLRVCTQ
jgi:hypothetical protein